MELERRDLVAALLAALLLPRAAAAQPPAGGPGPQGREAGAPAPRQDAPAGSRQQTSAAGPDSQPTVHALILCQSYPGDPRLALPNAARDGSLIAETFRRLRFERIAYLGESEAERTLDGVADFLESTGRDNIALLYVAGHGVEIAGENLYMLGDGESFLSLQALVEMLQARAGLTILFLDACRNNPFYGAAPSGRIARARAVRSGLGEKVRLETVKLDTLRSRDPAGRLRAFFLDGGGVKIVFSTAPGKFALDGARPSSRNSPFALALARRLRQPVSLDDAVSLATGDVRAATRSRQSPWSQGSVDRPIFLSPRKRRSKAVTGPRIGSRLGR